MLCQLDVKILATIHIHIQLIKPRKKKKDTFLMSIKFIRVNEAQISKAFEQGSIKNHAEAQISRMKTIFLQKFSKLLNPVVMFYNHSVTTPPTPTTISRSVRSAAELLTELCDEGVAH